MSRRARKTNQRARPGTAPAVSAPARTAMGRARRRSGNGEYTRGGTRRSGAAAARRGEGVVGAEGVFVKVTVATAIGSPPCPAMRSNGRSDIRTDVLPVKSRWDPPAETP